MTYYIILTISLPVTLTMPRILAYCYRCYKCYIFSVKCNGNKYRNERLPSTPPSGINETATYRNREIRYLNTESL